MQPTLENYEQAFGEGDERLLERARSEVARGSLAGDHEGLFEQTRGTLENFDVHVTTGSETHLTTMSDPFARYVHAVHNHIHPRWTAIIARWNITYGIDSSLSDRSLVTVLEYVIDRDGQMEDVRIVRSAREPMFMQEAVAMSWSIGPFPPPPPGMLSSDGRTYLHWTFHRDQRQCGTFGASVRFLQEGDSDEGK
jgi:TonB family protein